MTTPKVDEANNQLSSITSHIILNIPTWTHNQTNAHHSQKNYVNIYIHHLQTHSLVIFSTSQN